MVVLGGMGNIFGGMIAAVIMIAATASLYILIKKHKKFDMTLPEEERVIIW